VSRDLPRPVARVGAAPGLIDAGAVQAVVLGRLQWAATRFPLLARLFARAAPPPEAEPGEALPMPFAAGALALLQATPWPVVYAPRDPAGRAGAAPASADRPAPAAARPEGEPYLLRVRHAARGGVAPAGLATMPPAGRAAPGSPGFEPAAAGRPAGPPAIASERAPPAFGAPALELPPGAAQPGAPPPAARGGLVRPGETGTLAFPAPDLAPLPRAGEAPPPPAALAESATRAAPPRPGTPAGLPPPEPPHFATGVVATRLPLAPEVPRLSDPPLRLVLAPGRALPPAPAAGGPSGGEDASSPAGDASGGPAVAGPAAASRPAPGGVRRPASPAAVSLPRARERRGIPEAAPPATQRAAPAPAAGPRPPARSREAPGASAAVPAGAADLVMPPRPMPVPQAAASAGGTGPAAMPAPARPAPAATRAAPPLSAAEIGHLAEQVDRILARRAIVERERRGG
jgi:hypothetical protein